MPTFVRAIGKNLPEEYREYKKGAFLKHQGGFKFAVFDPEAEINQLILLGSNSTDTATLIYGGGYTAHTDPDYYKSMNYMGRLGHEELKHWPIDDQGKIVG